MPFLKKADPKKDLPKGPFLALRVSDTEWVPLEPGTQFRIVEDAENDNKFFPLTLKLVARNRLVFEMAETEYTYRLTEGKPLSANAVKRMKSARGDDK